MKIFHSVSIKETPSQSTLLLGSYLLETILKPRSLKGKRLALYLRKLLSDPQLDLKLSLLKSDKWKKQYQEPGQSLVPVFFFPDDCDWARLSMISNGTGFSRCYIFVYLMLLDIGILKMPEKNRTMDYNPMNIKLSKLVCSIILDEKEKTLRRNLKTKQKSNNQQNICG